MTLQEIQNQALQLSIGDRWQLIQVLLDSLKQLRDLNIFTVELNEVEAYFKCQIQVIN